MSKNWRSRSFLESANFAIMGIIAGYKQERNFRIHVLFSILVLLAGLKLGISRLDLVLLLLAITFVFMAELMNTSLELLTNTFVEEENSTAKLAKDISAGSVLISVIGAVSVGYLVFFEKLKMLLPHFSEQIKADPLHVAAVSLLLVLIISIIVKTWLKKGTPLLGGMPSGHSALAFATATIVFWFTHNALVNSAVFLLAFLVAQSRIQAKAHTWWEVTSGALLGFSFVLVLFWLFLR